MGKSKNSERDVSGSDVIHPLERLARVTRAAEHGGALNPAQREALRFLSRANRFSNSPGALARYLGATKGTISQTIKALESKGHVVKTGRTGESRSIALTLTAQGQAALARDPWMLLARAASELGGKTRRRLAKGLGELLAQELVRAELPPFGPCGSCRFYREKGRDLDPRGPHLCMLLDEPLSPSEAGRICAWAEPA